MTRKKVTQVSNVILLIEHLVSFSFLTFLNELVRGAVISLMDIFERSSILTPMLIRYFTCGSIVSGTWHLRALMTCVCGREKKIKQKKLFSSHCLEMRKENCFEVSSVRGSDSHFSSLLQAFPVVVGCLCSRQQHQRSFSVKLQVAEAEAEARSRRSFRGEGMRTPLREG